MFLRAHKITAKNETVDSLHVHAINIDRVEAMGPYLYHIISYHIISYHIISYHIISWSYHVISNFGAISYVKTKQLLRFLSVCEIWGNFVKNYINRSWNLKVLLHKCDTYNCYCLPHTRLCFYWIDFQLNTASPLQFHAFYRKIT